MIRTLTPLALLLCALPVSAAQAPAEDDAALHMELLVDKEAVEEQPRDKEVRCGKMSFTGKLKKLPELPKDKDLEYTDLKHSKLDELEEPCYKKRLVKKYLLQEGDLQKLSPVELKMAKKLIMLEKAKESLEQGLSDDKLEAVKKKKLLAAKKKLEKEQRAVRSKCEGMKSRLKCGGGR